MLQIVIVEDEKHSRETLKNIILEFCENVTINGLAETVVEAIELISNTKPDLVFLDIELQTGTGFDVLNALKDERFEVIFTTAFEQYAIKAIKYSSIDYLLKPIDVDELQKAIEHVRIKKDQEKYHKQLEILLTNFNQPVENLHNICLSTAEGIEFIKVADIIYCEANGSYTNFYLINGDKLMVSKHLKEYENLLPGNQFMRVHNSFLINLYEVLRYVKTDGGYILMNNNAMVTLSPKKRDEFLSKMASLSARKTSK